MNVSLSLSDLLSEEFQQALREAIKKSLLEIQPQLTAAEPDKLAYAAPKAAEVLGGICEKTLWNRTYPRGSIPSFKIGTRTMYKVRDLEAWIDAQKCQ